MPFIQRAKNILLTPEQEWRRIGREPGAIIQIFRDYVAPLAALSSTAWLLGAAAFGADLEKAAIGAAMGFMASIAGVYIYALVLNALAPRFGGGCDPVKAVKLAAYSWTPAAIGGVFGPIGLLAGLYGLYLLYLGAPFVWGEAGQRTSFWPEEGETEWEEEETAPAPAPVIPRARTINKVASNGF